MPRSYDVRVAALTIDASAKWLDNLLSHHQLPGVERARQGVERRISREGLVAIELVHVLVRRAGFAVGQAVAIVSRALQARAGSDLLLVLAPGVQLRIEAGEIERRMLERLADAIEAAPRVKRGRPPLDISKTNTPDA